MHELSLLNSLLTKMRELALEQNAKIVGAKIELGVFSHISASHFREHFQWATAGTELENVQLEIIEMQDINHPNAQEIVLASLEFADPNATT